eukprot:TRINITY_DN1400_c0_g1_i4.p1 TRINITY_DN1400_c0_g1~~TRINITY_DN1400_c0_g1_i4.p1  ORF type:complete len:413 (+),score=134.09 TRINITY_DN1400_c0_g1_i4:146-1384(+)
MSKAPKKPVEDMNRHRRRLSLLKAPDPESILDGIDESNAQTDVESKSQVAENNVNPPFHSYFARSKVGYMAFNPHKVNQDRALDVVNFGGRADRALFGVFDGHGVNGHLVSEFLIQHLPDLLQQQLADDPRSDMDPSAALTNAFRLAAIALFDSGIDISYSGSTACVLLFQGNQIFTANVGDSRAALATLQPNGKLKAVALSSDHKPDRPDEGQRIIQSGGRVQPCDSPAGFIGPSRVWLRNENVPGLAMTRSFGDLVAASVGVTAIPEIFAHVVTDQDKFVVLASDGVWEFIDNAEAVALASQCADSKEAVDLLVTQATASWTREEDVIDDITCIVIQLPDPLEDQAAAPAPPAPAPVARHPSKEAKPAAAASANANARPAAKPAAKPAAAPAPAPASAAAGALKKKSGSR